MGLIILTLLGLKYLPGWVKLVWLFQHAKMRQMVVRFAMFYTMKWRKPFYASLSTTSPSLNNPKTTPSISKSNYSPLSSERGRGRGFVCLTLFYALLSTTSPPLNNPKITSSISMANYSPLSSERGWGRGFICLLYQRRLHHYTSCLFVIFDGISCWLSVKTG